MFPLAATGAAGTQAHPHGFWPSGSGSSPTRCTRQPDAGGFHTAPLLGEAGAVAAGYQMRWLEMIRSTRSSPFEALLVSLLAVVAFSLILFDRSDRVYLWMGAVFLLLAHYADLALSMPGPAPEHSSTDQPGVGQIFFTPLIYAGWVMVWWVWFGLQRPARLPWSSPALTLLCMVSTPSVTEIFFTSSRHPVAAAFQYRRPGPPGCSCFSLLLWVVIEGIRRQGVEGWLVLPLVVLRGISAFHAELGFSIFGCYWFPFGVRIGLGDIANLLWWRSWLCCCCGGCCYPCAVSG